MGLWWLADPLDLFSTTQKTTAKNGLSTMSCAAPIIAYKRHDTKVWALSKACCNSWTCERCSVQRARTEYGRIVNGCAVLDEQSHDLYFLTITTRGQGLTLSEAHSGYLKWTNRLLSTLRANARKRGLAWFYAGVTEYQKRGHPHSHYLTTYRPDDLREGTRKRWYTKPDGRRAYERVPALLSDYLQQKCVSAGLGKVYDISKVQTSEGASRYVAKYLFKQLGQHWPKGWRRVRYSQSWPPLPQVENDDAFPLLTPQDWSLLARLTATVQPRDEDALHEVLHHLAGQDMLIDTRFVREYMDGASTVKAQ